MVKWLIGFTVAALLVVGSVLGVQARSGMDAGGGHNSILGQTAEQAGDDSVNLGGLAVLTVLAVGWLGGGALLVRSARRARQQAAAAGEHSRTVPT
jgi:hypothetical protein